MKNRRRVPTIIGLFVLIFGIAAGVVAVQSKLFLRIGATGKNSPANVRLADIAADSFSVSWVTDIPTIGFVKYGENEKDLATTATEQSSAAGYLHLVKLTGLKAQTTYFLKINSGSEDFDNNGVAWQTQTLEVPKIAINPTLISGTILTASSAPAPNVLVYIAIASNTYATLTSQNGSWVIPITEVLNDATTLLEISVQGGPEGIASTQIYPQSAKPVPTIILGQTYDFKSLPPSQSAEAPKADLTVPEQSARSSGFNVSDATQGSTAKTVTLTSIDNGEVVTTTKPELIGTAPTGTKLQIAVESELINGAVTVPSTGNWTWDVPKDLAPGNHKITITWKDTSGITQSLVRNFVVVASEGPAFVATPSATPTRTSTPTPTQTPLPTSGQATPSATPTPRFTATPLPSPSGQATPTISPTPRTTLTPMPTTFPEPVSGSLTPTILLSIMGIGLVALGFVFWKESNA